MFDHMWASLFPPQPQSLRRSSRETRIPSRRPSIAKLGLIVVALSASVAFPSAVAAADPTEPLGPSIMYQEAMAHAHDTSTAQPGGPVTVPFRPRPSDTDTVGGSLPVPLPAAAASGVAAPSAAERAAAPNGAVNVLRREVLGFLPRWELGTVTPNYATLSTIAYFGLGVNVNLTNQNDPAIGTLAKSGDDWDHWNSADMTKVINDAHAAGTRVVFAVNVFAWDDPGRAYQAQLLAYDPNRLKLAQSIAAEVARRGVDGVNLDFEPIASGQMANFTTFVRELRVALDAVHSGYEMTFCANGSAGSYDLGGLLAPGGADAVFVMAYDLRGGSPATAGSIDPMGGTITYTLPHIVNYFLTHGAPASSVILGLPFYGAAWSVGTTSPPVLNAKPADIPTYGAPVQPYYATAASLAAQDPTDPKLCRPGFPFPCVTGEQYDPVEQTAWVGYWMIVDEGTKFQKQANWREAYYDNPRSIGAKCDAIDGWNLRGVGIWAIGYDNGTVNNSALTNEIAAKFLSVATAGTYHAIPPARVLDTRNGTGSAGRLAANTPRTFQVAGVNGVGADATAITGNLTVVNPTNSWAIYLGPTAIASPRTSTLNFSRGQTIGNGLTVALSNTGTLSATYMSSGGNWTDAVLDVTGYYTADSTGATYHAVAPSRLLDTRSAIGLGGKFTANSSRTFPVAGAGGIPANAVAVTGNVTTVNSTNGWAIYLGPIATSTPATSTLNFGKGDVKGNNLTVSLDPNGQLSATFMSSAGNSTDLVFDVTGYYTADATGARFIPMNPARLLDSRAGTGLSGKFISNTPRTFQAAGGSGVAYNAIGITGNLTVANSTNGWAAYIGPNPQTSPSTSTLNFAKGQVAGNGFTVALSKSGSLSGTYISFGGNSADLVLDATGYFVPVP